MKFQVSNLFRKKEEPVENNAVETAEAQVQGKHQRQNQPQSRRQLPQRKK